MTDIYIHGHICTLIVMTNCITQLHKHVSECSMGMSTYMYAYVYYTYMYGCVCKQLCTCMYL